MTSKSIVVAAPLRTFINVEKNRGFSLYIKREVQLRPAKLLLQADERDFKICLEGQA